MRITQNPSVVLSPPWRGHSIISSLSAPSLHTSNVDVPFNFPGTCAAAAAGSTPTAAATIGSCSIVGVSSPRAASPTYAASPVPSRTFIHTLGQQFAPPSPPPLPIRRIESCPPPLQPQQRVETVASPQAQTARSSKTTSPRAAPKRTGGSASSSPRKRSDGAAHDVFCRYSQNGHNLSKREFLLLLRDIGLATGRVAHDGPLLKRMLHAFHADEDGRIGILGFQQFYRRYRDKFPPVGAASVPPILAAPALAIAPQVKPQVTPQSTPQAAKMHEEGATPSRRRPLMDSWRSTHLESIKEGSRLEATAVSSRKNSSLTDQDSVVADSYRTPPVIDCEARDPSASSEKSTGSTSKRVKDDDMVLNFTMDSLEALDKFSLEDRVAEVLESHGYTVNDLQNEPFWQFQDRHGEILLKGVGTRYKADEPQPDQFPLNLTMTVKFKKEEALPAEVKNLPAKAVGNGADVRQRENGCGSKDDIPPSPLRRSETASSIGSSRLGQKLEAEQRICEAPAASKQAAKGVEDRPRRRAPSNRIARQMAREAQGTESMQRLSAEMESVKAKCRVAREKTELGFRLISTRRSPSPDASDRLQLSEECTFPGATSAEERPQANKEYQRRLAEAKTTISRRLSPQTNARWALRHHETDANIAEARQALAAENRSRKEAIAKVVSTPQVRPSSADAVRFKRQLAKESKAKATHEAEVLAAENESYRQRIASTAANLPPPPSQPLPQRRAALGAADPRHLRYGSGCWAAMPSPRSPASKSRAGRA